MTTLGNQLPALEGTMGVSLSAALGTPGDVLATITIDAEAMTVISGIGTQNFVVDRGVSAIAHVVGATVTYAHVTPVTSIPALLPRIAAGVPTGAPTSTENGMAIDSTAVSGGVYGWNGSAWVKGASI